MAVDESGHLDAEAVAAYADGLLDASAEARVEGHLAECAECRHEVLAVRALLSERQHVRRSARWPVPLAAAAAILVMIAGPALWSGLREPRAPTVDRASGRGTSIVVVSPAPGAHLAADSVPRFTWHAPESGSRFHLTLVDDRGATVWETDTGDTTTALPSRLSLQPGGTYFWYVDALGTDGRSITSGAQRFTVR